VNRLAGDAGPFRELLPIFVDINALKASTLVI
jgi:hypothetical protein